jgi:hypothetical protein
MPRGRPPKENRDRKSVDLRIPVTEEQKAIIAEAVRAAGLDMAGWARPILLAAAEELAKKAGGRKGKSK